MSSSLGRCVAFKKILRQLVLVNISHDNVKYFRSSSHRALSTFQRPLLRDFVAEVKCAVPRNPEIANLAVNIPSVARNLIKNVLFSTKNSTKPVCRIIACNYDSNLCWSQMNFFSIFVSSEMFFQAYPSFWKLIYGGFCICVAQVYLRGQWFKELCPFHCILVYHKLAGENECFM